MLSIAPRKKNNPIVERNWNSFLSDTPCLLPPQGMLSGVTLDSWRPLELGTGEKDKEEAPITLAAQVGLPAENHSW